MGLKDPMRRDNRTEASAQLRDDSRISCLWVIVAIKEQRVGALPPRVLHTISSETNSSQATETHLVAHTPNGDALALGNIKTRTHNRGKVSRRRHLDVQLGDGHLGDLRGSQLLEHTLDVACRTGIEVRLGACGAMSA